MRFHMLLLASLAAVLQGGPDAFAQAQAPAAPSALTGQITSAEEGAMEGVLVSARKDGSPITITVSSDREGRFAFPSTKLEPGQYGLRIRAIGYELDGPKIVTVPATVAANATASIDVKLRRTRNIAAQLTNAEWLASMPGNDQQKVNLLGCVMCHTLERIVKSTHDAQGFLHTFERMASLLKPEHAAQAAIAPGSTHSPVRSGRPRSAGAPALCRIRVRCQFERNWKLELSAKKLSRARPVATRGRSSRNMTFRVPPCSPMT